MTDPTAREPIEAPPWESPSMQAFEEWYASVGEHWQSDDFKCAAWMGWCARSDHQRTIEDISREAPHG